jgi:glutathione synthase
MRSLRIAVQMDPIEKMIVNHDTSLALMVEAQSRGHEIWWWAPDDLVYELGVVKAKARRVSVSLQGRCALQDARRNNARGG